MRLTHFLSFNPKARALGMTVPANEEVARGAFGTLLL